MTPLIKDMDLVILVIFVAAQVHVLQTVQMTVMAMGNVRRVNVSASRDSWVQTAVSVHKELSVLGVSEIVHYLDMLALETYF